MQESKQDDYKCPVCGGDLYDTNTEKTGEQQCTNCGNHYPK
jgi:DNA-directed RNA polymerase subunit RPC12/RpoP